jgi:hypothetical protein
MPERSPPLAQVEHQLAGRLRLRVSAKRHDPAFFTFVEDRLLQAPGIRRLRTNPRTGSILVEHADGVAAIAAFAREQGLFDLALTVPRPAAAAARTPRTGRSSVHPLSVTAAGLAGLGAYQVARGRFFGSAVEHLWHGYGAYRTLNMPLLALGLAGLGLYRLTTGHILNPAATLLFHALTARAMAGRNSGEAGRRLPPVRPG